MATTRKVRAAQAQREAAVAEAVDRLIEGDDTVEGVRWENWDMGQRLEVNREALKRFITDYPERVQ